MKDAGLYDTDFFEWTLRTAALLRSGRIAEADIEHIAEEIEDMGKRDRRGVYSRLRVLIAHLLKRKLQPERSGASWIETNSEQRDRLSLILRDSPSLRRYAESALDEV